MSLVTDHADAPWQSVLSDPVLSRPPVQGSPGRVPAGGDLSLDIGWGRFEQLLVAVAPGIEGLSEIQFRRYGVSGQAQGGIDLAGRRADGSYVVVQCKDYQKFTGANLSEAVKTFTTGSRPFGAEHLVIAVSTQTGTTQLEDRLAALRDEHPDLRIDLWGAEQINDALRRRNDVVARFWTRETADDFCTGAPPAGVGAPAPNWLRVADQILLGPLGVDGADEQLATAEMLRADDPASAAEVYRQLADSLDAEEFTGHAFVVRNKQLDALGEAGEVDAAVELTARLATTALHVGDVHQAELLIQRLDDSAHAQLLGGTSRHQGEGAADHVDHGHAARARHGALVRAAVRLARHPLSDREALVTLLRTAPPDVSAPAYQPLLVLLVAETVQADATGTPCDQPVTAPAHAPPPPGGPAMTSLAAELDDLITSAIAQMVQTPSTVVGQDTLLRLRLVRAGYDVDEREALVDEAYRRALPRPHLALVLAAQARRDALAGMAERAITHWRQAVESALHEGLTGDAAGWLYAIRTVNSRYGPWTTNIDDEHLLAQALPKTGSGRLIRRVRDPEADARRAALRGEPIEAIRAAHRWLADSIVTGDWVDEQGATNLLGDLYARNAEPDRAATCYQWIGEITKLTKLIKDVGDHLLPFSPIGAGPWWQQASSLAGLAAQKDLLDDEAAGQLLPVLLGLIVRGRAGELIEDPRWSLTLQATKTACAVAARGTATDAQALLDLFADDVARQPNQYQRHDAEHVQACRAIAAHHPQLAWPALVRIFDLAEVATSEALDALDSPLVRDLLHEPAAASGGEPGDAWPLSLPDALTAGQRQQLRERLHAMAAEHYKAGIALASLGETNPATTQRAIQARDRLVQRAEPTENGFSGGTNLVNDAYLVAMALEPSDQQACLGKMLTVAEDRREAAPNRHEALAAAGNLVIDQGDDVKSSVHARSRAFADGTRDGSAFDDQVTNPHPLSSMKVDLGPATLRASGLDLALRSAVTEEDRRWVRERAVDMLRDGDERLVRAAAVTLSRLGAKTPDAPDAALLAVHSLPAVRKLAIVIAAAAPVRYAHALRALAADPDGAVRILLARTLYDARTTAAGDLLLAETAPTHDVGDQQHGLTIITEVLEMLVEDARHTVRRAAAGHPIA